ncbi:FAD-dependent oxidoreductase [Mesorhizobium sp. CA8]|uniref:NAD(P)/FAD-dependent oxidoreductase n=1 Tax=unclassified Mesorhizobium TaxID=325217 RepID=UPI001CD01314|nr:MULTISPECIES: FAD-dependent oxidoreductase [unclassified Mesorhizobium]MBZ9761676.1 FAD-dependent oxidoreductase [Mesorhizobium sp. CA8]MBZ9820570.1 FAD-dependent oxidoreductase [Mesorhizobium sp. CA4]
MSDFLIIGAGLAGHQAALELRKHEPGASITLLGDEAGLPYDRPPLSKAVLLGDSKASQRTLEEAADYDALDIDYRPSTAAISIDRAAKTVVTDRGSATYGRLLITTGSRPRQLPAAVEIGAPVSTFRTLADAERLRRHLRPGRSIVVVGGGLIGLEVSAAARAHGCEVTLLEAGDRLVARALPEFAGAWVLDLQIRNGVHVLFGVEIHEIAVDDQQRALVRTSRGDFVADAVVIGIGVDPNSEIAKSAGLTVEDGIVVDRQCRTSDISIFAAGDVSAHPVGTTGRHRRAQSWRTAQLQPLVAAKIMACGKASYTEAPWFWSDQFGSNLQIIGEVPPDADLLANGDVSSDRWSVIAVIGGQVVGRSR